MVKDFFQEIDQRIFMVDEEAYGYPYDPETDNAAWTAIDESCPNVIPVNIITESFDYEIPRRLHEKIMAIGGGKHPAMIVNMVQDPVDISFETKMQHPLFMSYAVGVEASAGTVAEISTIIPPVKADCVEDSYFFINDIIATGEKHYVIWIDKDGAGAAGKPAFHGIPATNVLQADISGDTTDQQVSDTITATINTTSSITATNGGGTTPTITCTNDVIGAVRDIRDSVAIPTLFTFAVTTQGVSTHTITPSTGYALPSFTLHIEQYNSSDSTESIYIDLFGCVITECEITVDYADKIIKEAVTIKSVNYAVGAKLLDPPNFIEIIEPFVWQNLYVTTNEYLIMAGTTTKTPAIVSKTAFKVTNDVEFHPGIGVAYATTVVNKKREVSLNIVGFTKIKDLFDAFKDTWDNTNKYYTTVAAKLNSVFSIVRTTTNDYFKIIIDNWLITECNQHVFNIDEGIKGIDITFTDAVPDTGGASIISEFTIADYLSETCYQNGTWTPP